jgi:hypothetical protein
MKIRESLAVIGKYLLGVQKKKDHDNIFVSEYLEFDSYKLMLTFDAVKL